jgi:ribonuclease-3
MAVDESQLRALASRVGYAEGQLGRLREAMTHKSFANEANDGSPYNERLEFLGDAVLGMVVADALMAAHPKAAEGTLSRLRAGLVNARSLAEAARTLAMGDALRMGKGEERSGGRKKASLLADAFEAMLGAVYLDLGFEAARAQVLQHFGGVVSHEETRAADRDHKTRLQELAQLRFQVTPVYTLVNSRGPDHQKLFEVSVSLHGHEMGQGTGASKKRAEREAARVACERIIDARIFELLPVSTIEDDPASAASSAASSAHTAASLAPAETPAPEPEAADEVDA